MDTQKTLTSLAFALAGSLLNAGYALVPEVRFGKYVVDFYEPEQHLAFEADSDFWHSPRWRRRHDKQRDASLLAEYNLPVIRFTEAEINSLQEIYA